MKEEPDYIDGIRDGMSFGEIIGALKTIVVIALIATIVMVLV